MTTLAITTLLIALAAASFLILERVRPGRELPNSPGWYPRALINDVFSFASRGGKWRATVDEDGHYCFAVAL